MNNFIEAIMSFLADLFNWNTMPEAPTPSPEPLTVTQPTITLDTPKIAPEANITPSLEDFLKWQWQFEGANPDNRNPGNFRYFYGGYLPMYEPVGVSKGGFAIFPTLDLGELYATNSTKNVIKHHPELTILTYIGGDGTWGGYAPASDKNPVTAYATFISSHLGVSNSFLMKDLV